MNLFMPYFLAFFAMICYAVMPVLLKKLQLEVPPLATMATTMLFLFLFSTAASLCFERDFSILKISPKTWGNLIFFGFVNFIGFAVFMLAIAKIPVVHYQLIGIVAPVLSGIFAYWLLKEDFRPQYLYGLVFIGIGLFIALREGAK
jgi:drug/metabolite transporter (DMT)-like permease